MAWNWSWQRFFDPGRFTEGDKPVPDRYRDRDQIMAMVNGGIGNGADNGYGSQNVTNMQAPQLQMGDDPFRQAQLQQMGQLQQVAAGQQQGAGELAVQRQMANAIAAQQAQARNARGTNAALAYRNAARQQAAIGSTGAGMAQQSAMQDQAQARQQLGGLTAAGRQSDIGVANANAGYQQAGQQMNSQNYLQLLNQLQSMNAGELGISQQAALEANRNTNGAQGGALQAGGTVLGAVFSDERLKEDIADGRTDADELLDALMVKTWRYKDAKHGEGKHLGPMAQDIERSRIGREMVLDTPEGKMVDLKKAVTAILASAGRLNERVRKLEGR